MILLMMASVVVVQKPLVGGAGACVKIGIDSVAVSLLVSPVARRPFNGPK